MKDFVEERVQSGGYGSGSEYVRELVRRDQKERAEERLETLLVEARQRPRRSSVAEILGDAGRVGGQANPGPQAPLMGRVIVLPAARADLLEQAA